MNFAKTSWFQFISSGLFAIFFSFASASLCLGQGFGLESAGARFGFYEAGAGSDFHQAEGFVNWNLPWSWDLGSSWSLSSRLDTSLGWLGESGANAALATFGPSLAIGRRRFPLSFEAGVSPTLLSRWDFKTKDFGVPFQFSSHVGINFDIVSRIRVSYRFQHMSNGGLSDPNPGLNMHLFGLSYLF